MRRRKRENQILKGLLLAAAGVAICIAGLILFFVFIWWRAQGAEPTTDEEVAALMQRQIELLESYSGKETVRHEKRAG